MNTMSALLALLQSHTWLCTCKPRPFHTPKGQPLALFVRQHLRSPVIYTHPRMGWACFYHGGTWGSIQVPENFCLHSSTGAELFTAVAFAAAQHNAVSPSPLSTLDLVLWTRENQTKKEERWLRWSVWGVFWLPSSRARGIKWWEVERKKWN